MTGEKRVKNSRWNQERETLLRELAEKVEEGEMSWNQVGRLMEVTGSTAKEKFKRIIGNELKKDPTYQARSKRQKEYMDRLYPNR